jgi:hypothetical protein
VGWFSDSKARSSLPVAEMGQLHHMKLVQESATTSRKKYARKRIRLKLHYIMTHFNIFLASTLMFSNSILHFWFSDQNFICIYHVFHDPHRSFLAISHPIIFDEEYKLKRSSLCSSLQVPATNSLLDPNIQLCSLLSNALSLVPPLL